MEESMAGVIFNAQKTMVYCSLMISLDYEDT